jgi:peptide/nickel transport system ATP-binding protein
MSQLLEVRDVSKVFHTGGLLAPVMVPAVQHVDFAISADKPEIFTIIGESGSGKTTLARMILGLEQPSSGTVAFEGHSMAHQSGAERLKFMASVQPVFQNPFEAFNPLKKVDRYLESTARRFLGVKDKAGIAAAMDEALQKVGLSLAEVAGRFPHELSGGQLQRVAIARALIPNPRLLIADEPVSMVDASLRMAIVNLLRSLRDDFGVSVIYITHDLATAYYISDRLIIMQKGKVVETGPARVVLDAPEHAYSRLLRSAVLDTADAGAGNLKVDAELGALAAQVASQTGRLETRADGRSVRVY